MNTNELYYFVYRLHVDYGYCDTSTPLNPIESWDKPNPYMTNEEALTKSMKMLEEDTDVKSWQVTKIWFPKSGGWAVKCEVLASHNIPGSRLEFPRSEFSEID